MNIFFITNRLHENELNSTLLSNIIFFLIFSKWAKLLLKCSSYKASQKLFFYGVCVCFITFSPFYFDAIDLMSWARLVSMLKPWLEALLFTMERPHYQPSGDIYFRNISFYDSSYIKRVVQIMHPSFSLPIGPTHNIY